MWRRSGRIEDRARARVDSKAGSEKLRDGGVVHGESTYLFKVSLQS